MIRNLDARTTRIEQIPPTLATKAALERYTTKEDLTVASSGLEQRLGARIGDVNSRVSVLHEDVKSDMGLLAEHLADLSQKVDRLLARG